MNCEIYVGKEEKLYTAPQDFKNICGIYKGLEIDKFYLAMHEPIQIEIFLNFLLYFYDNITKTYEIPDVEEKYKWYHIMDKYEFSELLMVANYLEIDSVIKLCCAYMSELIKGKDPNEIRKIVLKN